jgi:signal transduction histidine kinase
MKSVSVLDQYGEPDNTVGEQLTYQNVEQLLNASAKTGYFVFNGFRHCIKPLLEVADSACYLLIRESDSEHKKTQTLTHALEVLRSISLDLEKCQSLDEIFIHSVQGALDYIGLDRARILLFNDVQNRICGTWGTDSHGAIQDEHSVCMGTEDVPWYAESLTAVGNVVLQDNMRLDKEEGEAIVGWTIVATIRYGDEIVGWLVCDNLIHGRQITPNERTLILLYSQTIGQWIARFKAEQKLKELNESLEHKVEQKTAELQDIIHRLATTREDLVNTEKARTLANFTAGIAHEINNPIGFIRSNLSFIGKVSSQILESVSQSDQNGIGDAIEHLKEVDEVIDESVQGLDRVTHIISLLQPLNNLSGEEYQAFDLMQAIDFIILSLEKNADCIAVIQPEQPIMAELPMQVFTLALENILNNALEAVVGEDRPEIFVQASENIAQILVEVIDNGSGISASDLNSIFDPFFTTKAVGDGVGLGLSLSENLVKMVNGSIKVKSTEGKGTHMVLIFPKGIYTA